VLLPVSGIRKGFCRRAEEHPTVCRGIEIILVFPLVTDVLFQRFAKALIASPGNFLKYKQGKIWLLTKGSDLNYRRSTKDIHLWVNFNGRQSGCPAYTSNMAWK
jgi:hypothetical protein